MTHQRTVQGFTLLEVILTFVIFAIVCLVAVTTFNRGMTRTDIPVKQLQTDASLQLVLENMIADKTSSYQNDLVGFNATLDAVGSVASKYATGGGGSYIISQKEFVCPVSGAFVATAGTNQFLLVTVKPSNTSGISLTYLFNSSNNTCSGH
jgi:type II secretory pathway pseudopilin PulG